MAEVGCTQGPSLGHMRGLRTGFDRLKDAWLNGPHAVQIDADDFLTREEANARLGRFAPDVYSLAANGLVVAGGRATDGVLGVSAESLERELQWRRTATPWNWLRRGIATVLQYL